MGVDRRRLTRQKKEETETETETTERLPGVSLRDPKQDVVLSAPAEKTTYCGFVERLKSYPYRKERS